MKIPRTNKLKIVEKQLRKLIQDSVNSSKNNGTEVCGFLIFNGFFIEMVQLRNKSRKGGSFSFYTSEVKAIELAASRLNHEIIGTFHSHPAWFSEPGENDIESAVDDSLMLIIDCIEKEANLWHIRNKQARKLRIELI